MKYRSHKIAISIMPSFIAFLLLSFYFLGGATAIKGQKMNSQPQIKLPSPNLKGKISLEEAIFKRRSIRIFKDEALSLEEVSQLLWSLQGITNSAKGLRTAPSAGATYPLEIYVVAGKIKNLEAGIYRYNPRQHSLILHYKGDVRRALSEASLRQESILQAPVSFVIAAVFSRTEIRYGKRAERYVYMEVGHAAQNLHLQAAALDLGSVPIGAFQDKMAKETLYLPKEEEPLYIIPVGKY